MASTYSTNLALELIGTGDQAGSWGNTTNTNLGTLIEQAISGYVTQAVATGTDTTITIPNGATGVARNMYIELTGTGGTNTNLIVPANKKLYFIYNNSTGAVTVKVSGQTGISVPQGKKVVLTSNGTDVVNGLNYIADFGSNSATITQLTATSATITNLTLTSLVISNLSVASANITTLTSASATITNLLGTTLTISGNSFLATSSGNVGIGTSSPNAKLDVLTTASTRLLFTERSTGGNVIDSVNGGNSAYTQFLLNGSTLIFATGATERMRIDSSGNVGIGVTPTANTTSKLFNSGDFTRVGGSGGYLLNLYYDSVQARWEYAGTGTAAGFIDSGSGNFTFQTTGSTSGNAGDAATALAERARITSTGNFLVGTTTDVASRSGTISDISGNVRAIPRVGSAKTAVYTLAISDVGQYVEIGTGGGLDVPNGIFSTGDVVSVFNNTTGNRTISLTITTAYLAGTDADKASVTLATRGIATILFISNSVCVLTGNLT